MITHYFGTSLESSGHYLWTIRNGELEWNNRLLRDEKVPFDLECLSNNMPNGTVHYMTSHSFLGKYTVVSIAGSAYDERPGSKSVFYVEGHLSYEEMKEQILGTPCCKRIIDNMPFDVQWDFK